MCAEEKGKEMILANTNVYLKTWGPFVFINYSVIIEINSLLCYKEFHVCGHACSHMLYKNAHVGARAHV